ncbi:MAG: DUF6036 family nucleotidyltransferase [Oscillospiraceae bacterium]|nr:DUF6036 family nucleotidyltransferase [Oscillospiraceae bacterium]
MLSRENILNNLARLGQLLKEQGMEGEILLTGGAAMCLVHSARDMTKDVDALYEPKTIVNRLVAQIAEEKDLPANWMNDGVKGFVTDTAQVEDFMQLEGLKITTVSAEYLLSMKLMSARFGEKDYEDIAFLLNKLKIGSVDKAAEVLTTFFPANKILPKTMYVLEEFFAEQESVQEPETNPNQGMKFS